MRSVVVAIALSACAPGAYDSVFQASENGGAFSAEPRGAPSEPGRPRSRFLDYACELGQHAPNAAGRLHATPIDKALVALDRQWDQTFRYA